MGMGVDIRNRLARRAAEEIHNGMVVNLGIGIPSLVPNHLSKEIMVMFHAENGITGMGPSPEKGEEDENLCNAGGYPVTLGRGGSYCDSAVAFGMIRRGRVDITILGSLQVSQYGDLANWIVPGKKVPGMGGAMELAQKAKKVIVLMNHCDKQGNSKIVPRCTFPLTTKACVDLIVTELAIFQVKSQGLLLTELFAPYDLGDVVKKTDCEFMISENVRRIPY
ncbi:3-oxoacid CoA-transferase subunit B [Neobacillus pocheonensis]|uniref:3-oxoacid CoA-transferase subunit B n=1 Tax=Neobacillus pocheonensis TaxID=363869 RepID=A0ABT0W8J8_9BACI|nr:3-oxoacid CoA-transferase subunit B [Neobacillus pocheonensis]